MANAAFTYSFTASNTYSVTKVEYCLGRDWSRHSQTYRFDQPIRVETGKTYTFRLNTDGTGEITECPTTLS